VKWAEFLEKSFPARADQDVVVQSSKQHYEDLSTRVVGVDFTQDTVIIQTEETE
jgi:hypothetical protein